VIPVHNEIVKIVPEGLLDDSGKVHKVDILVCATGFNLAFAPPFKVLGVEGANMADEFNPEPHVYLAVTVPKFPNYLSSMAFEGIGQLAQPFRHMRFKLNTSCNAQNECKRRTFEP